VTQGVGAVDEQTGAFPALVAERWRADGCEVELQNAGISGYTAGQILAEQVPQIESFAPTIVTFQAGGNDIVNGVPIDEYRNNVKSVLDAATDSGARVIVLAQNEWFRSPEGKNYVGEDGAAQRSAFDDVLIEETSAHGAEFVDMRRFTPSRPNRGSGSKTVSIRLPRRTRRGPRSSARRSLRPVVPSRRRRRKGAIRRAHP
jgi:hypothetical protein